MNDIVLNKNFIIQFIYVYSRTKFWSKGKYNVFKPMILNGALHTE